MTDTLSITIQFFGAFRQFSTWLNNENQLTLTLPNPCTITDIRVEFNAQLKSLYSAYDERLLAQSIFANNDSILPDVTVIDKSANLYIIPPVSGG